MTSRRPRLALLIATTVATAVAAAGCSSSGSAKASTGTNATTTTAPPASPAPYANTGPYAVGFTTRHLADGRRVVIWYPVKPGDTTGHTQESIDIGGMLSPALQKRIPAKDRVKYKDNAYADATAAPIAGGYPVVIFSHGFAGYPEQSAARSLCGVFQAERARHVEQDRRVL